MAYKTIRETCFFKTGREGVVLEFLDEMYPNLFDMNSNIENSILKKYSKFKVTLVDSRNKSGTGNAVFYNLGPDEVLLLSYLLSDGNAEHFKKRTGAYNAKSQTEQIFIRNIVETFDKIDFVRYDRLMSYEGTKDSTSITFQKNINTSGDDLLIRKFTLSYEEAMRSASKWKITIEEGVGKKDTAKGNGLNIVKSGTFQSKLKSFLMLQVEEIVIPINEAASRVMFARESFYPLMKTAEVDFTKRKMEAKDFEGEQIDTWNPQGASLFKKEEPIEKKEDPKKVQETMVAKPIEQPKEISKKTEPTKETSSTTDSKCSDCGVDIADKVKAYSSKQFGKPLCYACQKKAKG